MKYEWSKVTLLSVCSRLSSGKSISSKLLKEKGVLPVYGGNGVRGYIEEGENFNGECAIIGRQGAYCGNVRFFSGKAYMTEHAIVVQANECADTRFLAYKLSLMQLGRLSGQSAQPGLSVKVLGEQVIDIPPLPIQRKIASILSALDDKIETNNAICRNLEDMARSIFKKTYKAGNNYHLGIVGDVVTLQRGYDLPKSKIQEGVYPVAGSTDIIAYHSEYNCDAPCIIMGRSGNVGKPRLYLEKVWAHNTSLFSRTFHESDPIWVYYSLLDMDFSTLMGGSAVPTLNRNHVHIQPLSIAPLQIQRAFSREVMPLLLLIDTVSKENKQLSELRNVLMPRLMSGEYEVDRLGLWR